VFKSRVRDKGQLKQSVSTLDFESYDIGSTHGFLPEEEPTSTFGDSASANLKSLEELGKEIPELLEEHKLRRTVDKMKLIPSGAFEMLSRGEVVMATRIYAFLASAYVHQLEEPPVRKLPRALAVPFSGLSKRIGRNFPILSYDLYALNNWRRLDKNGPIALENMDTIQKFVTLKDEPWFVLVHVEMEAEAAPAITSIGRLQQAVLRDDQESARFALETIAESIKRTIKTLNRMPEGNDPNLYAFTFRPYIGMFEKVTYEGVENLGKSPTFRGETGAQSSIIPSLDLALGIRHQKTGLTDYVAEMTNYMPGAHREFIEEVRKNETARPVREYIRDEGKPSTVKRYNECIETIIEFRQKHLEFAVNYIFTKVKDSHGTGGTPFMKWLAQLRDETKEQILPT